MSVGIVGFENVQKLITFDAHTEGMPKLQSPKGHNKDFPPSLYDAAGTPNQMANKTSKLYINNYDMRYERIRSGMQNNHKRLQMGGIEGDFREFEAELDRLDSRERKRKEQNNKGHVDIILHNVKPPTTASLPPSSQAQTSKEKLLK